MLLVEFDGGCELDGLELAGFMVPAFELEVLGLVSALLEVLLLGFCSAVLD